MRKVFLQMVVSLDGFVTSADGDPTWLFESMGPDVGAWIQESLSGVETQLLGRAAYQEQEGHWPSATDELAPIMNESEKIVFTRTPSAVGELKWQNSRFATGTPAEEIAALRTRPGNDLYVPGGASFAQQLSADGLIDEYRLVIHPVVLGAGLPLFRESTKLALTDSRRFASGTLANTYVPRQHASS